MTREFTTGANRDSDDDKYDYEGFLSPIVLEAFAAYMHENRKTLDGTYRASDNWQKGIPQDAYIKSAYRHFHDWTKICRNMPVPEGELGATMGVLFNVMGWVFERIKTDPEWLQRELAVYKDHRVKELVARRSKECATKQRSAGNTMSWHHRIIGTNDDL